MGACRFRTWFICNCGEVDGGVEGGKEGKVDATRCEGFTKLAAVEQKKKLSRGGRFQRLHNN